MYREGRLASRARRPESGGGSSAVDEYPSVAGGLRLVVGDLHLHPVVGGLHLAMGGLHPAMGDLHSVSDGLHPAADGLHPVVGAPHRALGGPYPVVGELSGRLRNNLGRHCAVVAFSHSCLYLPLSSDEIDN